MAFGADVVGVVDDGGVRFWGSAGGAAAAAAAAVLATIDEDSESLSEEVPESRSD